jgi:hypothetical protein
MTGERWNELIQLYEQRRLTFPECRRRLKEEVEAAKDRLAADGVFIAAAMSRLRDKSFRVRTLACESLGLLACPAVVAPLLQLERRESSQFVRQVIRSALFGFPASCIPEFLRVRSSYLAHEALIHMGRPTVEPVCDLLAGATAEQDITSLVSILRQIGDPHAGPTLEAAYVSHRHGRSYVLDALMRSGLPHPIPVIRHAMTDSDWGLRCGGAKLAAALGVSELLPEIQVAQRDVEEPVRRAATEALEALKGKGGTGIAAIPVVTIPEIFIADADSAVIIDLREQRVSDEVAEMFLLPMRTETVGPFDSYDVKYCRCRPIEIHKYDGSGNAIRGVITSFAVPLPTADMTNSLAQDGIQVIVPREFYIRFNDKKLGGRISRCDAESLCDREPLFAAENFPLRQPVLIALPTRFDDTTGRASIRVQKREKPRKRVSMLFEGAFGLPLDPMLDETTVPRPYRSFQTRFGSSEWLSAETECVRRAFSFGRLKRLAKGRHKNQIQIVSPGAGQKGSDLQTGLFERHVCAEAFRIEREHRSIFERSGMFSALFAFSEMPTLPYAFLKKPSTIIGISLGLAVAIWNAVGQVWIDLWNAQEESDHGEDAGFLAFFRQFQKVRLSIPAEHISLSDIVENAVASVASSEGESRPALAVGSDAHRALVAVGLREHELNAFSETFARWDAFRRFFIKVSQKRDPEPVDLEPYGDILPDERLHAFLDGMSHITKFDDVEDQAASLIQLMESIGVQFELDSNTGVASHFRVTTERSGSTVLVKPCIHFGSRGKVDAHGIVMLLHELAHAALHSRWMGELALMLYCAERIEGTRPFTAAAIREIVSSARRRMIMMHSAVERAADRFALRFLLTPSFVEHLRMTFVEKGGSVRIFELDAIIQMRLGIDHHIYYERFGPLIWPSLGMGSMATDGALPLTPKMLDAMDKTSDRRLEKLLRDHWAMVRGVLEQPEAANKPGMVSGRSRIELSFDGIACE